jgi:hypothetical protein
MNLLCWRGGERIKVCAQQKLHQKHTRCMTRVSTSRVSELHCCWAFWLRRALGWWTLGAGYNLWSVHNQLLSFLAASGRRKRRGLFPLLRACSVLWGKKEFQGGEENKRKGSSSHGISWEGGQRSPCRYETLAMPRNYLRSVVCKGECVSCKDLHHETGKSSLYLAQMSSFACQISRVGRSERQIHLSNRKRGCLRWYKEDYWWGRMLWISEEFDLVLTPKGLFSPRDIIIVHHLLGLSFLWRYYKHRSFSAGLSLAPLVIKVNSNFNVIATACLTVFIGCHRSVKPAPPSVSVLLFGPH